MSITTAQVREIRTELAKLKSVKVTFDGNRNLTVKEAVFALAPILDRMKKRGFDTQEIADKLHEKGIEVKPPTLAKYLNELRRGKDRKTDTPRPPETNIPAPPHGEKQPQAGSAKPMKINTEAASQQVQSPGSIVVKPDTPRDEL